MRYDFSAGGVYALAWLNDTTDNWSESSTKIVMDILSIGKGNMGDYHDFACASMRLNISIHSSSYETYSPFSYSIDGLTGSAMKFGFADSGDLDSPFIIELQQDVALYPYHLLISTSEMYLGINEWQFNETPSTFNPTENDYSPIWFTQPSGTGQLSY